MRTISALLLFCVTAFPLCARADLAAQIQMAREAQDDTAEIELLRRWLDKKPDDAAARQQLVSLWLALPDYNMAEAALADWKNPDPGFAARAAAQIAWKRDEDIEKALGILRARAQADPSDRETRLLLASYLARDGYRPEQLAVLDKLIAENPDAGLLLDRAEARRLLDDPAGAVKDAKKAASMDPDSARIKNALPDYERLEKSLAEIAKIDKALQRDPASAGLRLERALWLLYAALPAKALADAEAGLKQTPGSLAATILKVRAMAALGQTDNAKALAEFHIDLSKPTETPDVLRGIFQADKEIAKNPKNAAAFVTRSFHLNNDGQFRLALLDCQAARDLDPSNVTALNNAAFASCRLGNLPDATAYAQSLEALKPSPAALAQVLGFLADLAFQQSNFTLALEFADRSLAAKSDPGMWKLKAATLTRLGRTTEADAALKAAKTSGPTKK